MKKAVSICLSLVMVLFLGGCGGPEPEASAKESKSPAQQLQEAAMGFEDERLDVEVSTREWEAVSAGEGYVYVLSQTDPEKLALPAEEHYTLCREDTVEGRRFYETDPTGAVVREMTVPLEEGEAVNSYCFLDGDFWCIRDRYTEDPETGERTYSALDARLERWEDGTLAESIDLAQTLGLSEEDTLVGGLTECPDGHMVMKNETGLFWLDGQGKLLGSCTLDDGIYGLVRDRDGALYLSNQNIRSAPVQKLDCEKFTLEEPLFTCEADDLILSGSGPYDFFLKGKTLRGISLEAGTITELFTLSEIGLTDATDVIYLDEDTLLLQNYGALAGERRYLMAKKTPPEEVPEKKTVTLAFGMDDGLLSEGFRWQDCDGSLEDEIADFNLTNGTYEIQVVEFSTDGGLNLLLAGGEVPDIICWNGSESLLEPYIRQGYLTDLKPLMDADPETQSEDLLPNILAGLTASDGGIYQITGKFFVQTMRAHSSMVGTESGWSFQELYETAQAMPEGMVLMKSDAKGFLTNMLQYTLPTFIDAEAGNCDFGGEEFSALMYTARDYFPEAWDEDAPESFYEVEGLVGGEVLLQWDPFAGGVSYGAETLPEYRQAGVTVIGYPGVSGSGAVAMLDHGFSICSFAAEPEGAWAFLRNYLTYDFQKNAFGVQFPVRRDAFLDSQAASRAADCPECTDEDFEAEKQLVMDAVVPAFQSRELVDIIVEEAAPFLGGEKTLEAVIPLIENRVGIYLSEQS